ncbi:Major facilitator superfamily [Paraburkholderia ribeironis]|uniref:Major facilitator superfamily n=1 Tax=Paraburkholderia ribeironis TaxID=1247936 RepID=A0A1N7SGH3_9BURK|nr:MFS transporter [Paraburkholderia ribeironis]SIT46493.1 Major facilitator superfamily [Paraburkholderia ribeironis]
MERNLTSSSGASGGVWSAQSSAGTEASAYRWVALFIVWAAFLVSYVDRVAWSTVAAPVGASLGISVAMLGAFVTAFYAGYVLANVIGGMLTDLLGGRAMMTLALLPLGVFTFFFGETRSLTAGIAIQLAMGLAAGADYSAGMKIIPAWFTRDRGRAMGIYTTATSLAVVLANAIVPSFSAQHGWSNAFRMLGVVTFAWGIVALLFLKNRPANVQPPKRNSAKEMLGLLRNRNLIVLAIAGFGGLWATVGFGAWGNALMTKQYGISPVVAGSIIASFGIGAVIAKPTLGWISDLPGVSRRMMSILCLLAFAITLLIFGACSTTRQFYLVAPILGAFSFGYLPVLMAQISDASGKRLAGASAGWTNAIWQTGSAVSPLAVGQVYGHTHSFMLALLTLAVGPVVGMVAMLFVSKHISRE